jgi:uncharacterized protein YhbP (UPF0306 family)
MSADRPTVDAPPHVIEYMRAHSVLSLATASAAGVPHAATQVYVNDGLAIYFCTRPETRTAQHIDQNPMVAFTIGEYSPDWTKTKGIQGAGESSVLLDPGEIRQIVNFFQQKFPFLSDARSTHLSVFRITPSELQFIDNEATVGEPAGQTLGMNYRRSLAYSVFRDLPQQEIENVAGKLDAIQVDAGTIIVRQGAPADKFFIIVDGEVEVLREENGSQHSLGFMKKGQFFGEIAILRDSPRTATVRAVTPTSLLTMDRDAFRGVVAQSLATTLDFDKVIQQRLSKDNLAAGGGR